MDECQTSPGKPPPCTCVADAFADLPPELRPQQAPRMGGLRKVSCPGCGLAYWTNRETDVCMDCEKQGRTGGQLDRQDR